MVPLVGASGAISGLMGLFTVMYGKERINVFYSLGFYFNTIRFPAILLLPFWLGNECYQMLTNTASNVAYAAHLGGLLSGAGFGFINNRFLHLHDPDIFTCDDSDEISPLVDKALQHIGNLELEKGRELLAEAYEKGPARRGFSYISSMWTSTHRNRNAFTARPENCSIIYV